MSYSIKISFIITLDVSPRLGRYRAKHTEDKFKLLEFYISTLYLSEFRY
jgi:hypothetical protein